MQFLKRFISMCRPKPVSPSRQDDKSLAITLSDLRLMRTVFVELNDRTCDILARMLAGGLVITLLDMQRDVAPIRLDDLHSVMQYTSKFDPTDSVGYVLATKNGVTFNFEGPSGTINIDMYYSGYGTTYLRIVCGSSIVNCEVADTKHCPKMSDAEHCDTVLLFHPVVRCLLAHGVPLTYITVSDDRQLIKSI